jgi:hypothetical protein
MIRPGSTNRELASTFSASAGPRCPGSIARRPSDPVPRQMPPVTHPSSALSDSGNGLGAASRPQVRSDAVITSQWRPATCGYSI